MVRINSSTMRARSLRKLLRTTACGVSSSSPAISARSTAVTKSSGRPRASRRRRGTTGFPPAVSARAAVKAGGGRGGDPVAARLRQRSQRLRQPVDEAVDAGRIGQAREKLAGDVDRERRRAIEGGGVFRSARPRASRSPPPRAAGPLPRAAEARAAARWASASSAAWRSASSPAGGDVAPSPPRPPRAPRSPASSQPLRRRELWPPRRAAPSMIATTGRKRNRPGSR